MVRAVVGLDLGLGNRGGLYRMRAVVGLDVGSGCGFAMHHSDDQQQREESPHRKVAVPECLLVQVPAKDVSTHNLTFLLCYLTFLYFITITSQFRPRQ